MTVQPEADYRRDPYFRFPERVPWSELGPHFYAAWGRADPSDPQPEHFEIVGPSGSGKSYLLCTVEQGMQVRRKTSCVLICTKRADRVFAKLGWPTCSSIDEVRKERNCLYWPQTSATGTRRDAYLEAKIRELMEWLWKPDANLHVAFDEVAKVEGLSAELHALVQMYWREGRSLGITVVGMKQRPQGTQRDMHSESPWTAGFKPKDRSDAERWAELFGARRDWLPVLDDLDRRNREFILASPVHDEAYISWVDTELHPVKVKRRTPSWFRPAA